MLTRKYRNYKIEEKKQRERVLIGNKIENKNLLDDLNKLAG